MKILQICNKVPYPPKDGGAIAITTLSEAFTDNGHQVTLMAMSTYKHPASFDVIPVKYADKINFVYIPVNTNIRLLNLLWNLFFSRMPYNAERFISKGFSRALENLLTSNTFDVIQLEGLYLSPYIPIIRKYSKALLSLRAHNIESEIWERLKYNMTNPFRRFYLDILTRRMRIFEKAVINNYDLLVPISEKDSEYFKNEGNIKPLRVIAVGIPESYFSIVNQPVLSDSVFFIGALDWSPNIEGLNWFLDCVWEKLRLLKPSVTLHIAGRNAPEWVINKFAEQQIIFHGEVENAGAFFDTHHVMVVPLFSGSGLRVKIVESMAHSRVVVTTPIGAEGLEVENGKHLMIAENEDGFIHAIMKLLEDKEFYSNMGKNAFMLAKQKYSSYRIAIALIQFYQQNIIC